MKLPLTTLPRAKATLTKAMLVNPGWIAVFTDVFPTVINPVTNVDEKQFEPDTGVTDKGAPTLINLSVLEESNELWIPVAGRSENEFFRISSSASGDDYVIESVLFDGSNQEILEIGDASIQITEIHDFAGSQPLQTMSIGTFSFDLQAQGGDFADSGGSLPDLADDTAYLVEIFGTTPAADISATVSGRYLKRMTEVSAGDTPGNSHIRVEGPGETPFYLGKIGKNVAGAGNTSSFGNTASMRIYQLGF